MISPEPWSEPWSPCTAMLTTLASTAAATFGQSTLSPGRGPATEGASLIPAGEGDADTDPEPAAREEVASLSG